MTTNVGGPRVVVGYGTFFALFARATLEEGLWPLHIASNFFLDLKPTNDFRRRRLEMMTEHLGYNHRGSAATKLQFIKTDREKPNPTT